MANIPDEFLPILSKVKDPEIPVLTVVDMGVVRRVEGDKMHLEVDVTPTYSGCPAMDTIENEIYKAFTRADYQEVVVNRIIHPPWTTDWLSEEGKKKLEATGIAPPLGSADKQELLGSDVQVNCPYCKSKETKLISQFGSTACKSLYQCNDCGQPFDYFKCI
jgi:ring-1,2-phenylacetyl-CoA epoxidase subunit PaaD